MQTKDLNNNTINILLNTELIGVESLNNAYNNMYHNKYQY